MTFTYAEKCKLILKKHQHIVGNLETHGNVQTYRPLGLSVCTEETGVLVNFRNENHPDTEWLMPLEGWLSSSTSRPHKAAIDALRNVLAANQPMIGKTYKHCKGSIYQTTGLSLCTVGRGVIVRYINIGTYPKSGDPHIPIEWARPLTIWNQSVSGKPRFIQVQQNRSAAE